VSVGAHTPVDIRGGRARKSLVLLGVGVLLLCGCGNDADTVTLG
jgi:hypothetical protein